MKNPRDILEEYAYSEDSRNDKPKYSIDSALAQLEEYYKPKLLEKRDIEKKIITCPECNHTWAIAIIRGDK